MFTRVDVIAQNDDLWSFEFEDEIEADIFAGLCEDEGYRIEDYETIDYEGKWTAQEAFDCIQENS